MKDPMPTPRHRVLISLILAAAIARIVPHPANVTPIGAMALFAGAQFPQRRFAFLLPVAALFLSDLVLGLHSLMPFVYGCFLITVCLGFWVRRRPSGSRILLATGLSSLVFFAVTNFGNWAFLGTYPKTPSGLMDCYLAGLPFLRNSLLGDLAYTGLLFGGLALAERRYLWLRESAQRSATA